VKRRELIRHLQQNGCRELREGSKHTMYVNPRQKKVSATPRHTEINAILASKICRDLEIPEPS
jgi:predicted RNA binding protein YcfA (HicA-like mRNA interferase family)